MLSLVFKDGESAELVREDDGQVVMRLKVQGINGSCVRIAFDSGDDYTVWRSEILGRKRREETGI